MANRRTRAKRELAVVSVLMVVVAILMGVAYVRINRPTQGEREISIGVVGNADEEIWKAVQHELDARNTGIRVRLKSFQYGRYANQPWRIRRRISTPSSTMPSWSRSPGRTGTTSLL